MTYREILPPLKQLVWGSILVFLDFTLNINQFSIDFLPDWLGYWLIIQAVLHFRDEKLKKLLPLIICLWIYSAIFFLASLLAPSSEIWHAVYTPTGVFGQFVVIFALILNLYVYYSVITFLAELADKAESPIGDSLRFICAVYLICNTIVVVLSYIFPEITGVFTVLVFPFMLVVFVNACCLCLQGMKLLTHFEEGVRQNFNLD